jgi:DNA polymerase-3 subunit beta
VHVSALNTQTGEHAVDLSGAIKGKPNKITVNFRYFLDGVMNIEAETVALQLIDGVSPCLVRPANEKSDYLYIVMPIRQ